MSNYDFFVEYPVFVEYPKEYYEAQIKNATDANDNFADVKNIFARIKLLSRAIVKENKAYAEIGDRRNDMGLKFLIKKKKYDDMITNMINNYLDPLKIIIPSPNIEILPYASFLLQFTFTLAKPYLSKDDDEFYICNNPIKKDKVFKVPMTTASTWKGNMRWTARQVKKLNPDKPDDDAIKRLFGNERAKEKDFRRGRLNFYPTFFDQIGLEVINPHNRKTGAGNLPIYIESVPIGAKGTFSLLYVPFDLIGRPQQTVIKDVTEDLRLICDSLKEMMLTHGFSAKKSSGFGVIQDEFKKKNGGSRGIMRFKVKGGKRKELEFDSFDTMRNKTNKMLEMLGGN